VAKRKLVTLLTDFGTGDPYVAAMKGMILQGCPSADIVDVSHDVPAHDLLAGAFVLGYSAPFFPPDTLHVVVVDPEVGSDRKILAGRFGGQTFLFPDNGVISIVAAQMAMEGLFAVRNTQFLPPGLPSATFHGRDIFAPVAAHILNGVDISRLGPQPDRFKLLDFPGPDLTGPEIVGRVIYVDGFGNLVSNVAQKNIQARFELDKACVFCAGRQIGPLQGAYSFVPKGQLLAIVNSVDLLEIAVNQGRAGDVLNAGVGAEVRVTQGANNRVLGR
jgi:S-adenosylmethionine hydrolase